MEGALGGGRGAEAPCEGFSEHRRGMSRATRRRERATLAFCGGTHAPGVRHAPSAHAHRNPVPGRNQSPPCDFPLSLGVYAFLVFTSEHPASFRILNGSGRECTCERTECTNTSRDPKPSLNTPYDTALTAVHTPLRYRTQRVIRSLLRLLIARNRPRRTHDTIRRSPHRRLRTPKGRREQWRARQRGQRERCGRARGHTGERRDRRIRAR